MKKDIFDEICFKRTRLLKEDKTIGNKAWQFIEIDVGLLLNERERYRAVLKACRAYLDGEKVDKTILLNHLKLLLEE